MGKNQITCPTNAAQMDMVEYALALWDDLSDSQRAGLRKIQQDELMIRSPDHLGAGKVLIPVDWDEFLLLCKETGIDDALRNEILDIVDSTWDRVIPVGPSRFNEVLKVMFSSSSLKQATKGHLLSLKTIADNPNFAGAKFRLEVDSFESSRRIDIEAEFPDGRKIKMEVKAYESRDFDTIDWDKFFGGWGQFDRDLADSLRNATTLDDAFKDLMYIFPDPAKSPNVDLNLIRNRFLEPIDPVSGVVDEDLIPKALMEVIEETGQSPTDVYIRLKAAADSTLITTYDIP